MEYKPLRGVKILYVDDLYFSEYSCSLLKDYGASVLSWSQSREFRLSYFKLLLWMHWDLVIIEPLCFLEEDMPELERLLSLRGARVLVVTNSQSRLCGFEVLYKPQLPSEVAEKVKEILL